MAKFIIENNGPLKGEVTVSGAKNAVLPILAATVLTDEECIIDEVPDLKDVEVMCSILRCLGAEVKTYPEEGRVSVKMSSKVNTDPDKELLQKMRASILVLGPILVRENRATVWLPGGCAIGERPVELHYKGLRQMGSDIEVDDSGKVSTETDGLKGTEIYLDFPSVGATENIMMAATLAEGTTIIENAAQEPEIVDLANYLNKMGAKVKGAGTDIIRVEGVEKLHGAEHSVIPDRIEAGTFMVAAAMTRGNILIKNMLPNHMVPVIAKLRECGVVVEETELGVMVKADEKPLVSTDIKTLPYPGFPTDMQAQFMALLTTVEGSSIVIETVFENRYMHVAELKYMGAKIKVDDRCAIIEGNKKLKGARVRATDLRAGAAMVIAGLAAEGKTELSDIYHIERGYEKFVEKMQGLGAKISREED